MLKIVHVITGLGVGGAENVLARLLRGMDGRAFESTVISLTELGPVGSELRASGYDVRALNLSGVRGMPGACRRLSEIFDEIRPDVVQSWMYHADLLSALAARRQRIPVIWNVRQSDLSARVNKRSTLWVARACALVSSRLPSAVVYGSSAAKVSHRAFGYQPRLSRTIQNGIDCSRFYPLEGSKARLLAELGVSGVPPLVGIVARLDPQKDHMTFIRVASRILKRFPGAHFVMVGKGCDPGSRELREAITRAGIENSTHLLGSRNDIPEILSALDVSVLTSTGEGFPNVVAESMACGTPCVVTDVGDSYEIVGMPELVAPARDDLSLANKVVALLELGSDDLSHFSLRLRARIEERFSLDRMVQNYERLYGEMARRHSG